MQNNFEFSLPIDSYLEKIVKAFETTSNLILTAPPGSGKTMRAPAALLHDLIQKKIKKKIIVIVPRRIAATAAAARVAEENRWVLGNEVGYQVRFENKTTAPTQLIFMTEGVFLKKITDSHFWKELELVVFDEFHERSSAIDIALGVCLEKQILEESLKILVMSATLDVSQLQNYFKNAEWIEIQTKPFPLQIVKSKKSQKLICDHNFTQSIYEQIEEAWKKHEKDILVFLPGLSEMRQVQNLILKKAKNWNVSLLHGSISLAEQKSILAPSSERKVILSTNIAESSLTLPSLDCVIDSGLEKKSIVENKIGFKRLETVRISLFSATQRAGRASRKNPGTSYQMWHEIDERSMSEKIQPEILKSNLLEETLILLSLGFKNPTQFSWLDKPQSSFAETLERLKRWEMIQLNLTLSEKGSQIQQFPLDIERSLLFYELAAHGHFEFACRFLAFLETSDFSSLNTPLDLNHLPLSDLGFKIETQLLGFKKIFPAAAKVDIKSTLIQIYLKCFPEKMAQRKDKNSATSSLGRGVEFKDSMADKDDMYLLLFSGRDSHTQVTKADLVLGFSRKELEQLSQAAQQTQSTYHVDLEKKKIFRIDKKMLGYFVISESGRHYLKENEENLTFKQIFKDSFKDFLQEHPHWKNYLIKVQFLKRKASFLNLTETDFDFLETFTDLLFPQVSMGISGLDDFFNFNLAAILKMNTPEIIQKLLHQLPDSFQLPNEKIVKIDYETEQAPLISAKIQDFFGQLTTPKLLDNRLALTLELLAPNYRPTQITSNLEQFWVTSYHEIRKELRARYPKHSWPENPLDARPEKRPLAKK